MKVIEGISKTKLKIKTKPLVLAMLINLLVKITKRRRDPFCFHCEKNGADFNHWPFQCAWLNQILTEWHANQNATGHQTPSYI